MMIAGDMTDEAVPNELVEKTINKFGKLDILVGNHGGSFVESNEDGSWNISTFDPTFHQNTKSTLAICLKALPHLKETKGSIVLISSIAAIMSVDFSPFYAMAKAALDHLTRILAYRHAKDGVRVNCIE
ncbi:unnamed protein product [Toxocara canis]|uniref:Uncharacterized protein n=1 Tax=Toxocara canis TaxID=6265 RepID=A0A3P7GPR4_TOXCA|nr:unnamed protein product [Toxocara canis]